MKLETARCQCRLVREADRQMLQALYADQRTSQFTPVERDISDEAMYAKIQQWRAHWEEHGFGIWIIEKKLDDGEYQAIGVGGVSMRDFDGQQLPNLWYRFFPDTWGNGFASEFANACIVWLKQEAKLRAVFALVHPQNLASLRVVQKLGMHRDGELQLAQQKSLRLRLDLSS